MTKVEADWEKKSVIVEGENIDKGEEKIRKKEKAMEKKDLK